MPLTGWHRDYARRALRAVVARPPLPRGQKRAVRARKPRPPVYDAAVVDALGVVWALRDFPCGKRLAAVMSEVVDAMERHGEIVLDEVFRHRRPLGGRVVLTSCSPWLSWGRPPPS